MHSRNKYHADGKAKINNKYIPIRPFPIHETDIIIWLSQAQEIKKILTQPKIKFSRIATFFFFFFMAQVISRSRVPNFHCDGDGRTLFDFICKQT